jgi:hypothetical protein
MIDRVLDWLHTFQQQTEKSADYAERTLAAYRLGMKGGGAIVGVRVEVVDTCCETTCHIPPGAVYHPDDAPHLPMPNCPLGGSCRCVYRPVMVYEQANKKKT